MTTGKLPIKTSSGIVGLNLGYQDKSWYYQFIINGKPLPVIKDNEQLNIVKKSRDLEIINQFIHNGFKKEEAKRELNEIQEQVNTREIQCYFNSLLLKADAVNDKPEEDEEEQTLEDKYDTHIIAEANDILQNGDAIEYIMDVWRKQYAGDNDTSGYATLCALGSTYICNSKGIHIKASGTSAFGKSTGITKMFALMPSDKTRISSLSGKSVFYDNKLKPGMCLYVDDIDLSKLDLLTTIKQSTSEFQKITSHQTVVAGIGQTYDMPERIAWILSSVDPFDDEQLSSRFLHTEVVPNEEYGRKINHKQMENDNSYDTINDPSNETLICRCIFDIIGQDVYQIVTPFMIEGVLVWTDIMKPRNYPMFHDIVLVVTLFNLKKREKFHDFYISTVDDFCKAKEIYQKLAKINSTKLTENEIKVLETLTIEWNKPRTKEVDGKMDRNAIALTLGLHAQSAKNILHGKNNDGGLLGKVPGLFDERTQTETITGKTTKYYYWYIGCISNGSTDYVSLDETKVEAEVLRWKEGYIEHLKSKGRL